MPTPNLVELIRTGKTDKAKNFLDTYGLSDDIGEFGESPLMAAIQTENFDIAEKILDLNPDIHHEDEDGWNALECAALTGSSRIFAKILELGGDINRKQTDSLDLNSGMTPLHWAANRGHLDIVKLCVQHGAIVDALTEHGFTPLMYASSKAIALYLMDAGASVTHRNNSGRNASEEHFVQSEFWDPDNRKNEIAKITKPSLLARIKSLLKI